MFKQSSRCKERHRYYAHARPRRQFIIIYRYPFVAGLLHTPGPNPNINQLWSSGWRLNCMNLSAQVYIPLLSFSQQRDTGSGKRASKNEPSSISARYLYFAHHTQWSSSSTLACGATDPRFESRCGQKVLCFPENHCDTQLWARAAHLLQCPGRLAFQPPRDGK